jgi:hypothetical protein
LLESEKEHTTRLALFLGTRFVRMANIALVRMKDLPVTAPNEFSIASTLFTSRIVDLTATLQDVTGVAATIFVHSIEAHDEVEGKSEIDVEM